MATQITKAEMIAEYEDGTIHSIVNTGNRIYARSVKGQASNPKGFIVVWCMI